MPSEGSGSGDVGAVKPRRPLFKKSAFGKAAPTEEGTGSDLFSRSKELFEEALREKERERQSKLGRTQKSRAGAAAAGKRRRLSGEVDDEEVDARSSSDEKATTAAQKSRKSRVATPQRSQSVESASTIRSNGDLPSPKAPRTKSNTSPNSRSKASSKPVIYSLDDDDEDVVAPKQRRRGDPKPVLLDSDDDDNSGHKYRATLSPIEIREISPDPEDIEEFPELVAAARARARAHDPTIKSRLDQRLEQLRKSHAGTAFGNEQESPEPTSEIPTRHSPKIDLGDPTVDYFVTAMMKDARPIIAKRKLSMRLKEVRMVWCDRQVIDGKPLSEAEKKDFFLTFRKRRIFDSSTGRALGLKLNSNGELVIGGDGYEDGRIHLEAWTPELFATREKVDAERRRKAALDPMEQEEEPAPESVQEISRIRLILKAKEYEELKVVVRLTTSIQRLIDKYTRLAKVPSDKTVTLRFEGDELDPTTTVESMADDLDMDDVTNIDVYVN